MNGGVRGKSLEGNLTIISQENPGFKENHVKLRAIRPTGVIEFKTEWPDRDDWLITNRRVLILMFVLMLLKLQGLQLPVCGTWKHFYNTL